MGEARREKVGCGGVCAAGDMTKLVVWGCKCDASSFKLQASSFNHVTS